MASVLRIISRVSNAIPVADYAGLKGKPLSDPTQHFNPYRCTHDILDSNCLTEKNFNDSIIENETLADISALTFSFFL